MATLDQEKQIRETLNKNLDTLLGISIDSLIRRDEFGASLNFEEGKQYFERVLKLFKDIKETNLDGISFEALNQINNQVAVAIGDFKNIREFSIEKYPNNTKATRDQFINTIRDRYDEFYKILTPHIAYGIRKGTDFGALESQARGTLEELKEFRTKITEEQNKSKKEAESILDSMRKAAAEAGVSQHAIYFKEEADDHKIKSEAWLKATYLMAIGTIVYAIGATILYFIIQQSLDFNHMIQLAVAKILIFTVLYYATIWCGKNYRAYLHNFIANKHRQNSLSTFQAFVKATEDESTKNAVLLRATESIFNIGQTGFVSNETDSSGSPQILEIIRAGLNHKSEV